MNTQDFNQNDGSVLGVSSHSGEHSSRSIIFLVVIASFIFGLAPILVSSGSSSNQSVPVLGEAGVWSSLGK